MQWPYLPQEGDCTNDNHICILCRTKGHHPTFCPNAAWAIIFRKPKTFIPKDVRRQVLKLRGYETTIDELISYVNTEFLKSMTKHYSNLKEPNAVRGPKFSQQAFEKAEATWKIHHKLNPALKSHSTQTKQPKTNNLTIPVSDAIPTNPDEDEESNGREGSENKVQDSDSGSDA